jgi:hypothetical protein
MKTKVIYPSLILLSIFSVLSSCNKDVKTSTSSKTTTTSTLTSATLTADGAIALASVDSAGVKDSIYMVNCFPPHGNKPDSVAFSALPTAIGTYLSANYSGYTFTKAYKVDSAKVLVSYVVVIKYNGLFVGLKFTSTGTFVNVLEQKDGANMGGGGKGWHPGGPFCDRGGIQHDTIAIASVPAAVLTYFTTTYPTDTLLHAYKTPDTTYILISKDTVLYATNISATGTLIKRLKIEQKGGKHTEIAAASLLSAITTYLTTTYPGYVFDKAYVESNKTGVIGYHVFITVNSTNYEVGFDATGAFVKAVTIH